MKRLLYILLTAGVLGACSEEINLNIGQTSGQVVVFCVLREQGPQKVVVQRTVPYFGSMAADSVKNAAVTIAASTGEIYTTRYVEGAGYLTDTPFSTAAGVTYTLTVRCDHDGDPATPEATYTATTTARAPGQLDRMEIEPIELPFVSEDMHVYQIKIYGQDPPGRDFYIFRAAVDGKLVGEDRVDAWMYMGDRMFQNGKIDGIQLVNFAGRPPRENEEWGADDWWAEPGQTVALLMSRVEMGFMRFVADVQPDGGSNPLFGGPPHNAGTNIKGGALGYFGALCSSTVSAVVPLAER